MEHVPDSRHQTAPHAAGTVATETNRDRHPQFRETGLSKTKLLFPVIRLLAAVIILTVALGSTGEAHTSRSDHPRADGCRPTKLAGVSCVDDLLIHRGWICEWAPNCKSCTSYPTFNCQHEDGPVLVGWKKAPVF